MVSARRVLFKPKWSDSCLCGSGRKYKSCCKRRLPGFDIGKEYSKQVDDGNFQKALLAARADVCQYTIWHKTNVAPYIKDDVPDALQKFLQIDVNALGEYLLRVNWLYRKLDKASECEALFDNIRGNILHSRWQRKFTYIKALHELSFKSNREKAKAILSEIGPIEPNENDVELLQIFIDLNLETFGFAKRMEYLDQILTISDARSDQLQYRCIKAVQHLMIGDVDSTKAELLNSIQQSRDSAEDKPLDSYQRLFLARSLMILGYLEPNDNSAHEASEILETLLSEGGLTDEGKASIYRELGDCFKQIRDWQKAKGAYKNAIKIESSEILLVLLSETLVHAGGFQEAEAKLAGVKISDLSSNEYEDFVFVSARLALSSKDNGTLEKALLLLKELKLKEPYFREYRLELILRVSESLSSGKELTKRENDELNAQSGLTNASSLFLLQPNIFGIGINFNEIFKRISARKSKSLKNDKEQ